MSSIADSWWTEGRRDFFRSAGAVPSLSCDATRLGSSLDTILNDLELYDDPRRGDGAWLFENEPQLADQFGEELHNFVGDEEPVATVAKARVHSEWPKVQATAAALLSLMEDKGDFTR